MRTQFDSILPMLDHLVNFKMAVDKTYESTATPEFQERNPLVANGCFPNTHKGHSLLH